MSGQVIVRYICHNCFSLQAGPESGSNFRFLSRGVGSRDGVAEFRADA